MLFCGRHIAGNINKKPKNLGRKPKSLGQKPKSLSREPKSLGREPKSLSRKAKSFINLIKQTPLPANRKGVYLKYKEVL